MRITFSDLPAAVYGCSCNVLLWEIPASTHTRSTQPLSWLIIYLVSFWIAWIKTVPWGLFLYSLNNNVTEANDFLPHMRQVLLFCQSVFLMFVLSYPACFSLYMLHRLPASMSTFDLVSQLTALVLRVVDDGRRGWWPEAIFFHLASVTLLSG